MPIGNAGTSGGGPDRRAHQRRRPGAVTGIAVTAVDNTQRQLAVLARRRRQLERASARPSARRRAAARRRCDHLRPLRSGRRLQRHGRRRHHASRPGTAAPATPGEHSRPDVAGDRARRVQPASPTTTTTAARAGPRLDRRRRQSDRRQLPHRRRPASDQDQQRDRLPVAPGRPVGATSATLSFDYLSDLNAGSGGRVDIQVSNDGGASYTSIGSFTQQHAHRQPAASAPTSAPSSPATPASALRRSASRPGETLLVDNLQIACVIERRRIDRLQQRIGRVGDHGRLRSTMRRCAPARRQRRSWRPKTARTCRQPRSDSRA